MLGGFISDLEKGDVFKPVSYVLRPVQCREYAHGAEQSHEWFHAATPGRKQFRPPTMVHNDKMRLLEANCDKERRLSGSYARDQRVHFEYHAKHHSLAYVGEEIVVTGRIEDKYVKKGRTYLCYFLQVHADGRLVTTYRDRTIMRYTAEE